jgi:hypothetical protein
MEFTMPQAFRRLPLAAFGLMAGLGLAGCADTLGNIFTDEPPVAAAGSQPGIGAANAGERSNEVLTGKAPIRRMTESNAPYPNLAGVPGRPTAQASPAQRQADQAKLEADRAETAQVGEGQRARPVPSDAPAASVKVPDAPPPVPGRVAPPAP